MIMLPRTYACRRQNGTGRATKVLAAHAAAYVKASRNERSRLLDEMGLVTELHRKSLVRLMATEPVRKLRPRCRCRNCEHEVDDVIRVWPRVWITFVLNA